MKYYISLFCSDRQCDNRSITRVLEALSESAAKQTIFELNNENRKICPCCGKELNYYLDFQPDDFELEHEQSLL
ncbi:hypothetical protein [Ureibacillus chungkukjangi]|uniref:Uncharacterized protein n=1 Tax=Ureibacillus chungkukjangi TaxID=1202712 RepID=A0A318TFW1_9BACL|nr:hypothetical protein [Ureibacillus chungkukjangi]MCM3390298.1 hypothetical protein [Ureibacillus chungkukjangi]PYF02650.1 hypothetical protein BJ095_1385 [Ureibacillus chungkukjangi]